MSELIDMIGKKIGRLTVVERAENTKQGTTQWKCICECGNEVVILGSNLRQGRTKSCGCYQKECAKKRITTHGETKTRLFTVWQKIKDRCYNENHKSYKDYGGRGISMCDSWKDSFEAFRDWAIENGYSDDLTIDRIDVDGNYEPSNCRWVTQKEQQNNRTNNHLLTYNGETKTMAQWADEVGLPYHTIVARINKYSWTVEEALSTPVGQPRTKPDSL